jgi:uncharacterized protein YbaR (Trm112 family)
MTDHADPPTGRDVRGDLVCTQCARVAGRVQGANVRLAKSVELRVDDPRHVDAVRHLRCPHCAGRLWLQNSEEVPVDPLLFNREALRPYRGRPPKIPRMP